MTWCCHYRVCNAPEPLDDFWNCHRHCLMSNFSGAVKILPESVIVDEVAFDVLDLASLTTWCRHCLVFNFPGRQRLSEPVIVDDVAFNVLELSSLMFWFSTAVIVDDFVFKLSSLMMWRSMFWSCHR